MRHIITVFAMAAFMAIADEPVVDYVEGADSAAAITPEIKAAAAMMMGDNAAANLLHGVALTMRKYDMDMKTDVGRRAWHGKLISETVNTNGLYKIMTYSNTVDGAVWSYRMPFTPKPMVSVNAKARVTINKNGVPARLAAARAAREKQLNQGTITTNIVTNVR